jgi:hypothetical protein
MEICISAHEYYVSNECLDELKEICRLGNEFVDNFFSRVMQICHRFPEDDKPSDQLILNWFSYLISDLERFNLDDQLIANSQDSRLITKVRGYIIYNQNFDTTMEKSLHVILDPLAHECEPFNDSPLGNHEHIMVCKKSLIKEISSFSESEDLHALDTNLFDVGHPHEHPLVHHAAQHVNCFTNRTLNAKSKQQDFQVVMIQENLEGKKFIILQILEEMAPIQISH